MTSIYLYNMQMSLRPKGCVTPQRRNPAQLACCEVLFLQDFLADINGALVTAQLFRRIEVLSPSLTRPSQQ